MKRFRPGYSVGRDVPIERKIMFWVLLFFAAPLAMQAQERSNTYYASQFSGADVGAKVTNAQLSCSVNTAIPCSIVIDAILAGWPTGTMPTRCAQCAWIDYRTAGRISMGGNWQGMRAVDGANFATINAAENDCGTNSCIVYIPSTAPSGAGQDVQARDNIFTFDVRNLTASAQQQGTNLMFNVKDTANSGVRDKLMFVDVVNPALQMQAGNTSSSWYVHSFAEGNIQGYGTLEATNGTITVDTGATGTPSAVVGLEAECFVSGTAANTISSCRGGTYNIGLTGAGSITNGVAMQAQAATNTGSGTITNAIGLLAENQTVGTGLNLGIWNQGQTELDRVVSIGQPPVPGTALFVQPIGILTGGTQTGAQIVPQTTSAATATGIGLRARADTVAAAYTQALNQGLRVDTPTVGAGSAITEWDGLDIEAAPTAGTKCSIKMAGSTSGTTCINTSAVAGGTASIVIPASFTTTAAASDNVTVTGMTSTGHCGLQATNSAAAGGIASVFVSAKAANQITVTHTATAGWTFDVMCSPI